MSGQFISLPQFLSPHKKNLEQWTKKCKTDKLQLILAQADRSFISRTLPKEPFSSFLSTPLGFPVLFFWSPPFCYARFKVGLVPTMNQWKGMQISIPSRLIDNFKLYNNRLCCFCLPIIQSVIIRLDIEYSSALPGLFMAKGYLEKPLWFFCIHCVSRVHVQELQSLCGYLVASVSSPSCVWDGV